MGTTRTQSVQVSRMKALFAVHQNDVEHIEGIHRGDARHQRLLVPVKRLQSEATGIHLAPDP